MKFKKLLDLYADTRSELLLTKKELESEKHWGGKKQEANNLLRKEIERLEEAERLREGVNPPVCSGEVKEGEL